MKPQISDFPVREQFNTSAQTGTGHQRRMPGMGGVIVRGAGSDLANTNAVKSRAKRKQISKTLALTLVGLAEKCDNEKMAKSCWNTYHCLDKVHVSGGKIYGKYCKNRICTVCLGIRKAQMIERYLPVLKGWKQPHFVTLTVKSVPAKNLRAVIENMNMGFNRIVGKYKKRNQRNGSPRLAGIKSMECNFNPITRKYNPHFHLIVPDRETGETLIREWLASSKRGKTIIYAQNIQRIIDNEKCLIEVVKYGSKIFTEQDVDKKKRGTTIPFIYAKALYTILVAMQGHRIFDRFGFNMPKPTVVKEINEMMVTDFSEFEYDLSQTNWLDINTSELLTEYQPDSKIVFLLENRIDKELN